MAPTDIGDTDAANYIIDESSTYRWYLQGGDVSLFPKEQIKLIKYMDGSVHAFVTQRENVRYATITWDWDNLTHYQNLLKAVGYWYDNKKKLTLHVENELCTGSENLAVHATRGDYATLINWQGIVLLENLGRQARVSPVVGKFIVVTDIH
jgi:hypothetical protein